MGIEHTTLRRRVLGLVAALVVVMSASSSDGWCATREQGSSNAGAGRAAQADGLVAEGQGALDRGDAAAARSLFERALAANPKSAAAHTNLGILDDQAGDLEGAARHFAAAVRLAPSASTHNNLGVILTRLGRTREAAAEFEASLEKDPNQPNALVNLAQIRFAAGSAADLRAAADLLARAFVIEPSAETARAATVVALRRNDKTGASARFADYRASLAKDTSWRPSADAQLELGSALLEAGLLREAESELSEAIAAAPSNVVAINELAHVYIALGDLPAAGRTLEGAVARGVDAAPVYALLAQVYEKSGHVENAIPAMRLAIQRDPQSEKYRFAYGLLLMNAYAPGAAVIRLEEALKTFPDSPRLWFALGLAHFKNDRDEDAERALKRAIELDPKFAPATAYLGMIRAKVGASDEAIALYDEALRIDPSLGVVHYLVAEALLTKSETDVPRIEASLKRAVEMDPSFVPARLSFARVLMRAERWPEAAAELERAVALDPNVAEAYYQLGRVYNRLKRADEAKAAIATFERLSATRKEREQSDIQEVVRRLADVRF